MAKLDQPCKVCQERVAKYKCPRCIIEYCGIDCFKEHKETCQPVEQVQSKDKIVADQQIESSEQRTFDRILQDEQIKYYLRFDSLKYHLTGVYKLFTDPALSAEQTREGRKAVALKKLRNLRAGGTEENQLVEEFVVRVIELLDVQ
jgi:zinc finger HIT domain-containing protein 3